MQSQLFKFLLYATENVTSILFGLVGAALIARVFGPENVGRLSLVQSVSAIFIFFATFGLDHFIVRDFSQKKNTAELKVTLLFLQSIGWLMYVFAITVYYFFNGKLEEDIFLIFSVVVTTYFLRVLYFKLYLQAVNDAFSIATSAVVSRIIALVFLVYGSYHHFSYDIIVFYMPIQAVIQALMMWIGYRKHIVKNIEKSHVSFIRIRELLKESAPVMLATALFFGYSQADVMIVSYFVSTKEVGIYAAAMRLVPQVVFIGHITVMTFYSEINHLYQTDRDKFLAYATKIVRIQIFLGLLLSVSFCILSSWFISGLYGDKFSQSAPILSIGVWAWLFMLPACLLSRLLILAKLSKYELLKALIVAPLSIVLNLLFIPLFGISAAAWVYVCAFLMGDFLVYFLFKETRFMAAIWVDAVVSLIKSPVSSVKETILLFNSRHEH